MVGLLTRKNNRGIRGTMLPKTGRVKDSDETAEHHSCRLIENTKLENIFARIKDCPAPPSADEHTTFCDRHAARRADRAPSHRDRPAFAAENEFCRPDGTTELLQ